MPSALEEYKAEHILVNLDDHITPDARAELTSARQAVETEMEWDARTLAELTVTVYIIVKLSKQSS